MSRFVDEYHGKVKLDPLALPNTSDFPFEELCRRMDGELESDFFEPDLEREKMAKKFSKFLDWANAVSQCDQRGVKTIGIRLLAATWVLDPSRFHNCAGHMVAKSFGLERKCFERYAADFSRKFGIQNQFQSHNPQKLKGSR